MANKPLYSGIDVSQWQGKIDWVQAKAAGVQFAILRAGYGDALSYPGQYDPTFEYNYSECKRLGIPVGAYWYSYAVTEGQALQEAKSFYTKIKGKQFEMPLLNDLEEARVFNSGKLNECHKAWADYLEGLDCFVGIYTYRSAMSKFTERTATRYAMAIAEYGSQLNYNGPYGIWQNSSTIHVPGISGNVDHDYCYEDYPAIIKSRGKNGFPAQTTTKPTPTPTPAPTKPVKKTNEQIADEVIAGKWSAGDERKKMLEAAGYNYDAVQAIVDKKMSTKATKSVDDIAKEVIAGKWGVYPDRKRLLEAAGYNYDKVQKRVDQMLKK